MKKRSLFTVFTLALSLALSGCGAKQSSTPSTGSTSTTESKTLLVQTDTDLSSMDTAIATDGTSFVAQALIFSGLTDLDANNQPMPELASSWDVNADATVYTFHLVDAKWSNGDPVTANDFVFAWRRVVDPDTASEYAFIMDTVNMHNAAAVNAGELPVEELGVKALDDKTLEVTLDAPCDFFLGLTAFPTFYPLNEAFVKSKGDQYATSPENLLACGPYKMATWVSGNSFTFVKNESYFKASEQAKYVDGIDFKFIQDTQSAMLEYKSNKLDVVKLTGEMVDAYKYDEGYTNRLQSYLWYLSLNHTVDKFQNENLRKAISFAIDRESIAANVLKDGSVAAKGIIPQQFAYGPDGKDYRESNGTLTAYDAAKAGEYYKKAVAELGGDVTVELLFEDTEASKAVAEFIQYSLENNCPGITVNLNSKPKKTRLQLMNAQEYEIGLTRWGPDYADPQTYFDLFVSSNLSNNSGRYNSAKYDEIVLEATKGASSRDSKARWSLLEQAEFVLVQDDCGIVPVYQNGGAYMINTAVEGVEFHSASVDSYRHVTKK